MTDCDPRLRFRLWVDGELVDETWIDASSPDRDQLVDAMGRRHKALTDSADEGGRRWLAEVHDPAAPEAEASVRFGTDDRRLAEVYDPAKPTGEAYVRIGTESEQSGRSLGKHSGLWNESE